MKSFANIYGCLLKKKELVPALMLTLWSGLIFSATTTNQDPSIKGVPALKVRVGSPFNFTPSAVDPDGDPLIFNITNKPAWMSFNANTGALTGTPTVANIGLTPAAYVISVSDGKGGVAKLAAYNLLVQAGAAASNTAPFISGVPSLKVNVGTPFSFTPTASDANNDPLTFSITNKPSWASFNTATGALKGTPTVANLGLSTKGYTISVSDGKGGNASLSAFNISVVGTTSAVNTSPVISGTSATTAEVNTAYSFTPTASDADNDPLTFNVVNLPAWASFNPSTGAIVGTPTIADIGTINGIVIGVSDNKSGSASLAPFNLVVAVAPVVCPLTVAGEYECRVASLGAGTTFSLNNAPLGMVIQPRSGYLHWTPSPDQQGQHTVEFVRTLGAQIERSTLTFTVPPVTVAVAPGIYVAPNGSDTAAGTLTAPLATLQEAANRRALPGDTIYLRGGIYRNAGYGTAFDTRTTVNLARIARSGAIGQPITIRPHGNEYVKLVSDANGIVFSGVSYWRVQGLEVEGSTQSKSEQRALELWWDDTVVSTEIDGRGIAASNSHHIEILGCVVHDFTGAGINNSGSSYFTVADNVIYNNGWWSTSGVQGVANGKPATLPGDTDTNIIKIAMERNLVYGNQSSVISRVFSKGLVKMEIDEGNGLHMQNTEGTFFGAFLIKNNLLLYNGKAGVGINFADHGVIENNSFYANAYASLTSGDIVLRQSLSSSIANNLFHSSRDRRAIHDTRAEYAGIGTNYAVPVLAAGTIPSLVQVPSVFIDPANFDFRPSANVPASFGVDAAVLVQMEAKLLEYGLTPTTAPTPVDQDYVNNQKMRILHSWPDGVQPDLIFEDPETMRCYAYADRNDYPNPPSTGTVCP